MLQEGLEHDQITVNQKYNNATARYSWADENCIKKNYRVSRGKSIEPTVDKKCPKQTLTLVLKHRLRVK